jgi:mono/diheme cytochrome c family protein
MSSVHKGMPLWCASGLPLLAMLGAASGCKTPGGDDAALVASGRAVYEKQGCANCHAVNGQGGRKAPDLSRVGADAEHTPEWLVEHIKNPKAHNPRSSMPAFAGKIDDKDLLALGAYLASLK